ncbi:MAG: SCO1664 family protein [Actinomycetales bacterium]
MATDADPAGGLLTDEEAERLVATAELDVVGAMADASNATLYTRLTVAGKACGAAIYKPVTGEQPLWDFPPHTLHLREVATYRLARFAGLDVVPPTVLREGPFGPGSVQLWVGPPPEQAREQGGGVVDVCPPEEVPPGWKVVLRARDRRSSVVLCHADDPRLQQMALLDVLANNADRKGGHVIDRGDGRLAGVDHGLTFNVEHKLRTVLWGWAGQPVPSELVQAADRVCQGLAGELGEQLGPLLDGDELEALHERAVDLVRTGVFPGPQGRAPAIPWPAF